MSRQSKFSLSISEAAVFLGKSPVTLRSWEYQGLVRFPRVGNDRKLSIEDLRSLARVAADKNRITEDRLRLIEATLTMMELIENG